MVRNGGKRCGGKWREEMWWEMTGNSVLTPYTPTVPSPVHRHSQLATRNSQHTTTMAADSRGSTNSVIEESKTIGESDESSSSCAKYSAKSLMKAKGDIRPTTTSTSIGDRDRGNGINNSNSSGIDSTDDVDGRLDAAWNDAEREFESKRTSPQKLSPYDDDDEHFLGNVTVTIGGLYNRGDDLISSDSDITLRASNRTTTTTTSSSLFLPTNTIRHKSSDPLTAATTNNKQTLIQKYRVFLLKNQTSLDLIEHVMERFVFYGHLFQHDHTGISTEMYYAAWNIIRWMNDVVLEGWGEGIGMTVGTRSEWFSSSTKSDSSEGKLFETIFLRCNSAVPLIRAILTATTCIYPAMEAWTRRSLHYRPSYGTPQLENNDANNQHHGRQQQLDWERSQYRAAQVSYRLERVRFVARLTLLSISWWAQYRRRRCALGTDGNERRSMLTLPPLLKRGGELDPYEQPIPLRDVEEETKAMQYVGRRTGRRSVPSSPSRSCVSPKSNVSKSSALITWLSRLTPSKNRILYFYAVGELLHILRPLYWSHAENKQWQRRFSSDTVLQKQQTISTISTYSSWKAWWVSLLMDVISDKLLLSSYDGDSTSHRRVLAKGAGRHAHQRPPSVDHAQLEELERRRSRLMLYVLRSPMYNTVTSPLAIFIGKIVSMIPSLGLARWASEYILDLMSYWNNCRFMLES